jgi:hypothetical protein
MSTPAERKSFTGRNRSLLVLGGLTVFFGLLAGIALFQRAADSRPQNEPEPLFPGVTARINDLGAVTVTTKDGSVEARATDQGWVLPAKDNFPADFNTVRAMAVGVAGLETIEPATANPELHARLGLVAPDAGGDAVRIALADRNGQALADVLVSTTPQPPEPDGRNRLYVRRATENQSWLARTTLTPRTNVADWLDKNIVPVTRARVASAAVTPPTGPAYTVSRASAEAVDFSLANMPAQRELTYPGAANNTAFAAVDFEFDDVAPLVEADFARAAQHVTSTYDGLTITVRIAKKGEEDWATVTATADNAERETEAAAINAKTMGRTFRLPSFRASQFTTARDILLKPIGGGTPVTAP